LSLASKPAALDAAAAIAQGYPYSVQLIGDATWTIAGYPDAAVTLTADHVQFMRPRRTWVKVRSGRSMFRHCPRSRSRAALVSNPIWRPPSSAYAHRRTARAGLSGRERDGHLTDIRRNSRSDDGLVK
jgi:hypothetical protein